MSILQLLEAVNDGVDKNRLVSRVNLLYHLVTGEHEHLFIGHLKIEMCAKQLKSLFFS
jgi:hypothetical protein